VTRRRSLLLLILAGGAGALLYAFWPLALRGMGSLLAAGDPPAKADLIVVMRGDEAFYDRALTSARLFREGFAPAVYVSSALTDKGSQQLRARGIEMPSGQENIVSILRQSGVPCDRIILGRGAGGGTEGEMHRVLLIARARAAASVLIVTSWFHARRVAMLMRQVLRPTLAETLLVVADSEIGPHNWWTHRYAAITVLEEFVKLSLQATVGSIGFGDDPGEERGADAIGPLSSCASPAGMLR
jgi:uncharacterized SAM-binding protein YcdF (DUF218 family)